MCDLMHKLSKSTPAGPFGPDGWSADPMNRIIPAQRCLAWERLTPAERRLVNSVATGERLFAMTCEPVITGWEVHLWEHQALQQFSIRTVSLPLTDSTSREPGLLIGLLTGLMMAVLIGLLAWLLIWHTTW